MPRIPTINAEPGNVQTPDYGGPVRVGEHGGEDAGREMQRLGAKVMDIGRRLREQQDEIDYVDKASRAEAGMKTIRENLSRQPELVKEPLETEQWFRVQADSLYKQLESETKSNMVKQALRKHRAKHFPEQTRLAHMDGLKYWGEQQLGELSATVVGLTRQATEATDPAERSRVTATLHDMLDKSLENRIITAPQRQQALEKYREEVLLSDAYRDIQGGTFNRERYAGLVDSEKLRSLEKHWNTEVEKHYKRLEEARKQYNQRSRVDLMAAALARTATLADLQEAHRTGIIETEEDYQKFHKILTDPDGIPSDPATLNDVAVRVNRAYPTINQRQLDDLFAAGKLNRKDYVEAVNKHFSRAEHIEARVRSDLNEEQAQAEQELHLAVGKSPMDSYDDEDGKILSRAIMELSARSAAFPENGGTERPMAVGREIQDRIRESRRLRFTEKVQSVSKMLRFPAPDSATAAKKLNEQRKNLSPREIAVEEDKILDMMHAEGIVGEKALGKPPAEKPSTGTSQPNSGTESKPKPSSQKKKSKGFKD